MNDCQLHFLYIPIFRNYYDTFKAAIEADTNRIKGQYQQYVSKKETEKIREQFSAEQEKANRAQKDGMLQDAQQKVETAQKILTEKDQAAKKLQNENVKLKENLENELQEREGELTRLREKVWVIFFKVAAKVLENNFRFSKLYFICKSKRF